MKSIVLKTTKTWLAATLFTVSLLMLNSCEIEPYNSYGFDSTFSQSSTGLTMMGVKSAANIIRLRGDVFMDTGEMKVELIDPDGYIVYTQNFFAPGNYFIDETFKASRGIWKLRYTSLEGRGSIDLHATYR